MSAAWSNSAAARPHRAAAPAQLTSSRSGRWIACWSYVLDHRAAPGATRSCANWPRPCWLRPHPPGLGTADREPTEVEAVIDAFGPQLDPIERRQLAFAVEQQLPVTITYQSSTGGVTTRMISDIEMVNGLMYAWCHLREDDRVFAIDRVKAVTPVNH